MGKLPPNPKLLSFLSALSNLSKTSSSKSPFNHPSFSLRNPQSSLYPSLMKSLSLSHRPDLSLLLFLTLPSNSLFTPPLLNSFLHSLHLLNQPNLITRSISSLFPCFGLNPSNTSFTILLNSYSNLPNSIELVYDAFFRIENPDSVAFGSLIMFLCKMGRVEDALGVFDVMLERKIVPSVRTCTCIVRAYCFQGRVKDAEWFVRFMENGNEILPKPDVVIYTVLIDGFCLVRDFDSVKQVLEEAEGDNSSWKPNSITYTVYMSGLCRAGMLTEAFHQIGCMHEKGLQPTEEIVTILFDCLCKDPSTVFKAGILLQRSNELNWEVDSFFFNTLMGRFLELNEPIRVLKPLTDMFKKGIQPDTLSFTIFTRALCRVGKFRLAKFFTTRTEIDADVILYDSVIHELYRAREFRQVFCIYKHMIEKEIFPSKFTCRIIIDGLCRERKFLEAMSFVMKINGDEYLSDINLVSRLIKWLVKYKRLGLALQLFEEMSKRGFGLKVVLFDYLIKELCEKGYCKKEEFCNISVFLDYMLRIT